MSYTKSKSTNEPSIGHGQINFARQKFSSYNHFIPQQECVLSTRMPHSHFHFLCSLDRDIGIKTLIWH